MGHYSDSYDRDAEEARRRVKLDIEIMHSQMPPVGTLSERQAAALEFLLEAYAGHTMNYRERTIANVHLGRIKGELK